MNQSNDQNLTKKERQELARIQRGAELEKQRRRKSLKRAALWSFIILGLAAVAFGTVKLASRASTSINSTASIIAGVADQDHIMGNEKSPTTLIEFSDFQCPACAAYHPLVKELMKEYGSRIKFAYRNFPLSQHKNAALAAYAAEAAAKQNKFWEMHDMIFEHQNEWAEAENAQNIFTRYAASMHLDLGQFSSDVNSKTVKDKVSSDYENGIAAGVNATPTFFLNGKKIENPKSYDEFRNLINQILSAGS